MPRKGKNKTKAWRIQSPGNHMGRTLKLRNQMNAISMPKTLHSLGQKLMARIDPDTILSRYSNEKEKGEVNETV